MKHSKASLLIQHKGDNQYELKMLENNNSANPKWEIWKTGELRQLWELLTSILYKIEKIKLTITFRS